MVVVVCTEPVLFLMVLVLFFWLTVGAFLFFAILFKKRKGVKKNGKCLCRRNR